MPITYTGHTLKSDKQLTIDSLLFQPTQQLCHDANACNDTDAMMPAMMVMIILNRPHIKIR